VVDEGAEHGTHDDEDHVSPLSDQLDGADDFVDLAMPPDESAFLQDTPPAEPDNQPTKTSKLTPKTLISATISGMAAPAHSTKPQKKNRKQHSKKKHASSTNTGEALVVTKKS
jgi:hypothetical protein